MQTCWWDDCMYGLWRVEQVRKRSSWWLFAPPDRHVLMVATHELVAESNVYQEVIWEWLRNKKHRIDVNEHCWMTLRDNYADNLTEEQSCSPCLLIISLRLLILPISQHFWSCKTGIVHPRCHPSIQVLLPGFPTLLSHISFLQYLPFPTLMPWENRRPRETVLTIRSFGAITLTVRFWFSLAAKG